MSNLRNPKIIAASALFLLLTGFYWFSYRPQKAKGECAKIAETRARQEYSYTQPDFYLDDFSKYYTVCIKQKGY